MELSGVPDQRLSTVTPGQEARAQGDPRGPGLSRRVDTGLCYGVVWQSRITFHESCDLIPNFAVFWFVVITIVIVFSTPSHPAAARTINISFSISFLSIISAVLINPPGSRYSTSSRLP